MRHPHPLVYSQMKPFSEMKGMYGMNMYGMGITPAPRTELASRTTTEPPETTMPVLKTGLVVGGVVLLVGALVLFPYLGYKVGEAFAPTKAKENRYGWIGVGTVVFGLPLLGAVIRR